MEEKEDMLMATGDGDNNPNREQNKKPAGAQVLLFPFLFQFEIFLFGLIRGLMFAPEVIHVSCKGPLAPNPMHTSRLKQKSLLQFKLLCLHIA